ncbi:MAG TPA: sigma factor [Verrucomicrobiae bacterium]|nr:sigma factor [Verrucomicrobiae bacterium]
MMHAQQFEAFMRNHQNMVFSTAMRLTANRSEAEDISQEVFLWIIWDRDKQAWHDKIAGTEVVLLPRSLPLVCI